MKVIPLTLVTEEQLSHDYDTLYRAAARVLKQDNPCDIRRDSDGVVRCVDIRIQMARPGYSGYLSRHCGLAASQDRRQAQPYPQDGTPTVLADWLPHYEGSRHHDEYAVLPEAALATSVRRCKHSKPAERYFRGKFMYLFCYSCSKEWKIRVKKGHR